MSPTQFSRRVGDLEFRFLSEERFPEIVAWQTYDGSPSCYTLLRWQKNREGWDIEFIGARPFTWQKENWMASKLLWSMMEFGQKLLDADFHLEETTE